MRVFRIGAAVFTRTRKQAFSGQGGVYASARWHSAGRPIIYTAQSLSLAALEILVRLKQTNDIQPFDGYSMEIPDHLILTPKSLPVRWKSRIAVSRAFGDAWLKTSNLPALRVAYRDHSRRMECSRESPPSAVLAEMGRDGSRRLHVRCTTAAGQERDSVSTNATESMTPRLLTGVQ